MVLHHRILGEGPVVVILHGLFGSLDNWSGIAQLLSRHFRVVLCDQRNHGHSGHAAEMSYDLMAADVMETLEDQRIAEAAWIGHSMGGKTAMRAAQLFSPRVTALAIIDIAPKVYPRHHEEILHALLSLEVERLGSRQEADMRLAGSIHEPKVRQFLLKSLERTETGFRWRMNISALAANYDLLREMIPDKPAFGGPALFLRGENSDYIREEDFSAIQGIFPRATLVTVPRTGHWLQAERPEEVFRILLNFLQGV